MTGGVPLPPHNGGSVLERLLRASEEQAKWSGMLVEIQRDNRDRVAEIEAQSRFQTNALLRLVDELKEIETGRAQAVTTIKEHVTAQLAAGLSSSEMWWRRAFWVGIGIVAAAQVAGAGLSRLLALVKLGP